MKRLKSKSSKNHYACCVEKDIDMMKKNSLCLFVFLMLLLPASLFSQKIDAKLHFDKSEFTLNEKITGSVEIRVPQGYHAYQNPPSGPGQVPIEISSLSPSAYTVRAKYPKGQLKKIFPDDIEETAVYIGTVRVPIEMSLLNPSAGTKNIKLKIDFQLCDDSICLRPDSIEVNANVQIKTAQQDNHTRGTQQPHGTPIIPPPVLKPDSEKQEQNEKNQEPQEVPIRTVVKDSQVTWTAYLESADVRAGEWAVAIIEANIEEGWRIYSIRPTEGPLPTSFETDKLGVFEKVGTYSESLPIFKHDENFGIVVGMHSGKATFRVPVFIKKNEQGATSGNIIVRWMACTDTTCTRPMETLLKINLKIQQGAARGIFTSEPAIPENFYSAASKLPDGVIPTGGDNETGENNQTIAGEASSSEIERAKTEGLIAFVKLAFIAGLLALLTPCVFPMIPITVSYFSKRGSETKTDYAGATVFCFGIISTWTFVGVFSAAIFKAGGIQSFAGHPITNLALALIFILLALNLFGLYEIRLPGWLINSIQSKAGRGGLVGPFAMGMVFTLTSFTCTFAFVGALLAAAAKGDFTYPLIGMAAFGLAFSIPFFGLAIFPQLLSKNPKSGAWMFSVKSFLGFLELAAAVKFLSNADLVWQLGWLTRPVFLAVWAMIFIISGLCLLGWLRMPKEPAHDPRGPTRNFFGVATTAVGVYCLAGIAGTPMGEINAFLPPEPYPYKAGTKAAVAYKGAIPWVHGYEDAVKIAKQENKLLFIDFTGVQCTNCRWMEQNMFTRPSVIEAINQYVPVSLYTDRGTPDDKKNFALQLKMTGLDTLPVYVIATPDGKPLKRFEGSTRSESVFLEFLKSDNFVSEK